MRANGATPARSESRAVIARAVVALAVVLAVVMVPATAQALGGTWTLSPASGPAGTSVSVSGTSCTPGIILSGTLDFVDVAATTVPPTSVHVNVAANGSWHGTLAIPANAAAAPAAVTAICFSGGVESLLTLYLPKTFTVTAAPTSTTAAPATTLPPTTAPPTTVPTTDPSSTPPSTTPGTTPSSTKHQPGTTTTAGPKSPHKKSGGVPGSDGSQPPAGDPGGGSSPGGGAVGATTARGGTHHNATAGGSAATRARGGSSSDARAADLSSPTLAGLDATHHAHGLGLLWWLLVLVVVAACTGAGAWLYRARRGEDASLPL